ncbi:MAG TPA: DUF2807 domain-containing protein [Sphingomicrobium sp.]|jgi:hypothetical protein
MRSTLPLFTAVLLISVPAFADEVIPVGAFQSAELRGGGNVTVVPGPAQRVTIVEGSSRFTRITVDRDRQLRIDTCNEACPQQYRLRIVIQSPQVPALAVRGGGQITTAAGFGPQQHLAVAVNGGGKIDARTIDVGSVSAAVNGGGDLFVRPRASLAAAVNGGGHVRYWGSPALTTAVHGGGSVSAGY